MKSVRIDRFLASSAVGLVLALSSYAATAQQSNPQIQAAITAPETPNAPAQNTNNDNPANPAPTEAAPAAPPAPVAAPAAATPSPTIASADAPIADKLRELFAAKGTERLFARKTELTGADTYYKAHNYAPIWFTNGALNERAKAAIAYLKTVDAVGLDPADYAAPDFAAAATPDAQAEAEAKFTATVLTYARQAQIGRIHFTRVAADIDFKLDTPDPAVVMAKLADTFNMSATLDDFNPPQAEFKALKAKLAELRSAPPPAPEEAKPEPVKVPEGKMLRPGMKDARVAILRERLNVPGDKSNELYDDAVRDAVKAFQTQAEISVDGNLGLNTVKALNGAKKVAKVQMADPIDIIIVNMERWRWMPRDLGNPHVIVNVPDYTLTLWNDDKVYWHTKIVAGKPGKATPMVSAEMKFITVNPTWNVPPSIIENEYLPALQQDPDALERIGLKIRQDDDGTVHISQPPGAGNALGRIRFNFPNKFLVYQHDTPDKYLFAKEKRAYSHGCMRVQNPLTYGEKLLSLVLPNEHYTEARLEKMFGGSEVNINFPKNIWVHLTYQTAFVDADGKLQLREDIYGRDARMISLLKGNERKVADIAIERAPNSSSKPVRMPVGMYGGGGGNFFDFLFGGHGAPRVRRTDNNGRITVR